MSHSPVPLACETAPSLVFWCLGNLSPSLLLWTNLWSTSPSVEGSVTHYTTPIFPHILSPPWVTSVSTGMAHVSIRLLSSLSDPISTISLLLPLELPIPFARVCKSWIMIPQSCSSNTQFLRLPEFHKLTTLIICTISPSFSSPSWEKVILTYLNYLPIKIRSQVPPLPTSSHTHQ